MVCEICLRGRTYIIENEIDYCRNCFEDLVSRARIMADSKYDNF